jgi:ribose 5-phosphate isomerase B
LKYNARTTKGILLPRQTRKRWNVSFLTKSGVSKRNYPFNGRRYEVLAERRAEVLSTSSDPGEEIEYTGAVSQQRIVLGADHAAFRLKESLKQYCVKEGIDVIDIGAFSEDAVDYPDIAVKLVGVVLEQGVPGIFCCGTGIGASIAANRHRGIRAARCCTAEDARLARSDNDANVLCMGGRTINPNDAAEVLDVFLKTAFEGGRHQQRVEKLEM